MNKGSAGIGFAGVGIKIALLVCNEVVTETRRGTTHVASSCISRRDRKRRGTGLARPVSSPRAVIQ